MPWSKVKRLSFYIVILLAGLRLTVWARDWPMWGGSPNRNLVSTAKGIPSNWDIESRKNIKWVAEIGSQSYGNPSIAGGKVFVGASPNLWVYEDADGDLVPEKKTLLLTGFHGRDHDHVLGEPKHHRPVFAV